MKPENTNSQCTLVLDAETIQSLSARFRKVLEALALRAEWGGTEIFLSTRALADAFGEAAKDIEIMKKRRYPKSISRAKLAGVLAFRLVRWSPVHLSGGLLEDKKALKINFLAALAFNLKYILNVDIDDFPESATQELQYTLARRHTRFC